MKYLYCHEEAYRTIRFNLYLQDDLKAIRYKAVQVSIHGNKFPRCGMCGGYLNEHVGIYFSQDDIERTGNPMLLADWIDTQKKLKFLQGL